VQPIGTFRVVPALPTVLEPLRELAFNLWRGLWPGVPEGDVPITHITNAVHLRSWVSREMDRLYDRYLGQGWWQEPANADAWRNGIARVPAEELWRTHELRRERLLVFARRRLRQQLEQRGRSRATVEQADGVLNLDASRTSVRPWAVADSPAERIRLRRHLARRCGYASPCGYQRLRPHWPARAQGPDRATPRRRAGGRHRRPVGHADQRAPVQRACRQRSPNQPRRA
jgi:hypothetical protein